MTSVASTQDRNLRTGSWLMESGAVAFMGYAVVFFVLNFTDRFLELGIGIEQVDVGRAEIEAFSPSLVEYVGHLHIAVSGFIAATAVAVLFLVAIGVMQGKLWAWVGAVAGPRAGPPGGAARPLPERVRHPEPPGTDCLGTAVFVAGAVLALQGMATWRRSGTGLDSSRV
jgi:hypothetical protein